ncbi:MAG TPA: hypothetical protein VMO78_10875 [Rhizomicrobium sp.]|nr:hypothetical protein [Rhizomicrobium sp.]
MPQPDRKPSLAGGIALLVLGLVILIPSGLCTGVFAFGPWIESIMHPSRYDPSMAMLIPALAIGGPFVYMGGALVFAGFTRIRKSRKGGRERDIGSFD